MLAAGRGKIVVVCPNGRLSSGEDVGSIHDV